jgi:leucyl-tRNA synthetase
MQCTICCSNRIGKPASDTENAPEIEVFTTRPDTIFGATFMVLAPEHELVGRITAPECREKVDAYVHWAKNRSERERMAEVKKVSGEFTGSYAINPFTGTLIPVWIADYVLMGYGTGAIGPFRRTTVATLPLPRIISSLSFRLYARMAKALPILHLGRITRCQGRHHDPERFINGMEVKQAIKATISKVEEMGLGFGK